MRILKFKKFLEAISGTELVGNMGPAYGTDSKRNINSIPSEVTTSSNGDIDHQDDVYNKWLYYLKSGGKLSYTKWLETEY